MLRICTMAIVVCFCGTMAVAQCSLPIYDDFNDGDDDGWQRECYSSLSECSWDVIEGVYVLHGNSTIAVSTLSDVASCCDYSIEADVYNSWGNDKVIVGRYSNQMNHYQLNLRSNDNNLFFERKKNGVDTMLAIVPLSNSQGVWYHMKMVLTGPNIQCYIDGVLKIDIVDPDPNLCGAPALWGHTNQITKFDNVVVEESGTVTVERTSWCALKAKYSCD